MNAFQKLRLWLGWCPNASTIETRKSVQFDDIMVNAPDSGGELTHATARWWNKWRNRVLLNSFISTLLGINLLVLSGNENMNLFFAGMIAGVLFSIISGITEWKRLNKAAWYRKRQVTRRKHIINYLIICGLIAVVTFVTVFLLVKTGTRISGYYPFLSGVFLFAWTQYLVVVYWERKNRKTLIVEKTSFYAIESETGGSK
ncbi:MAG: DUF1673 family protein [Candidatus Methanoperedens sp.]|nr:DUF1673 family protein [Candidatus Methanoperedens sp.]